MISDAVPYRNTRKIREKVYLADGGFRILEPAVSAPRRRGRRDDMIGAGEAMKLSLIGHEFRFFGHRFHVLESSRGTGDGSLRIEYFAPPRANIPEHIHHFQEEQFEVVSGRLGVRVGGQESILSPGQSASGPPGVPHAWWNPNDEGEVCFVVGIRPGLGVEIVFETLVGLMREGKTIGPVPRNPLQLAVLAQEIGSWVVLTRVEKALFAPVAALTFVGRLLGYRTCYPEYSGWTGDG